MKMKVSEVDLGQTVYIDNGTESEGIVVKIKNSRLFCGSPSIVYYNVKVDDTFEVSLDCVYPTKRALYEGKLKRLEEEKNKYIEEYVDKTREIRKKLDKLIDAQLFKTV